MASVFNRGTRSSPSWYAKYIAGTGADGKPIWKMKATACASRVDAQKWADDFEAKLQRGEVADPKKLPTCGEQLPKWLATLTNRSASDDRYTTEKHIVPRLRGIRLVEVKVRVLLDWIDEMRAAKMSEATVRKVLGLVSRFYSWCIARELVEVNPVKNLPPSSRPQVLHRSDVPWLADDAQVRAIYRALPLPVDLMFYLGNRSGLRLGEICGLRISDLGFLDEGVIRVRYSYDGPLKEDKRRSGISKRVPAAADTTDVLAPWLARRQKQGAGPEDLVFPGPSGGLFNKMFICRAWHDAAIAAGVTRTLPATSPEEEPQLAPLLTFYQATRHSFVSRCLSRGASLDEVSAAVNHSSPVVTKRFYAHWVRKEFSSTMREGLGLVDGQGATVTAIRAR